MKAATASGVMCDKSGPSLESMQPERYITSIQRCRGSVEVKMITPDGEETMSVQELLDNLLAIPEEKPGMPVFTEGCDCYGNAVSVDVQLWPFQVKKDGKYTGEYVNLEGVLIGRSE